MKTLLPQVGIDPARVEMYNLSAAQGARWGEICAEFTERIENMGPSPVGLAMCKSSGKD